MAYQFSQRRCVTFAETDLAGIMHFSNFFRWMEETEHAFYRSLGLSVHPLAAGETVTETGWPRLKASAEYFLPLKFEEEAEVELLVAEMRTKAMRHIFRIWKNPDGDRRLAAAGEFVIVAVAAAPGTRVMKGVPIPEAFRVRISPAPAELLHPPSGV
jgi:acyl-CoA thioester hydrolase